MLEASRNKAETYLLYVEHLFWRSDNADARIFSKGLMRLPCVPYHEPEEPPPPKLPPPPLKPPPKPPLPKPPPRPE